MVSGRVAPVAAIPEPDMTLSRHPALRQSGSLSSNTWASVVP
ncbi:MAG TPA: hypothetical protein VH593_27660 [Ktedonobacteraceae bacterium]